MVDKQILQGCKQRDRKCQQKLYTICAPYAYAIARSYIWDDDFVKDVMQEAFVSVFRSIESYNEQKGSFKSWLAKIVTYKAIDFLKSNNRINISSGLEVVEHLVEDDFEYLDELTREDIEHLLSKMPMGYRTIFMLAAIDEYSHVEIGKMLNIGANTSRSQYHRALKWIKKNITVTPNQMRYEAL